MPGFDALQRELDRWAEAGQAATLWWRDDDAAAVTPALVRLLGLAEGHGLPLALAVVPARAEDGLPHVVRPHARACVLQHGYAHCNHAPAGGRACEFNPGRPLAEVRTELGRGRARLQTLFGARALAVLVPPWNRIDPALLVELPAQGLKGVSTFRARASAEPVVGLRQVNCHVDLIDWKGRCFAGADKVLGELSEHLAARRTGSADAGEPTGVLTHHLALDEDGWAFLDELLRCTRSHPGARWVDVAHSVWLT